MDIRLRKVVKMVTNWKYELQNGVPRSHSDDGDPSNPRKNTTTTIVKHPPCRMNKPRVTSTSSTSVCLEFDESVDIDVVQYYTVEYQIPSPALLPNYGNGIKVERGQNNQHSTSSIAIGHCIIDGLLPNQAYAFVVSAVNEIGTSQPSESTGSVTSGWKSGGKGIRLDDENDDDGKKEKKELETNKKNNRENQNDQKNQNYNTQKSNDQDATCCSCLPSLWCRRTMIKLAHTIETEDGEIDAYVSGSVSENTSGNMFENNNTTFNVSSKEYKPRKDWTSIIFHALLSQTGTLLALLLTLLGLCHGILFSVLLTLSWFLYGAFQNPRPSISYWNNLLLYLMIWMSANFIFNSPLFCLQMSVESSTNPGYLYPSFQPFCPKIDSSAVRLYIQNNPTNWLRLLSPVYKGNSDWLWLDIITILALLLHKQQLYVRGLWSSTCSSIESIERSAGNAGSGDSSSNNISYSNSSGISETPEQIVRRLSQDMNEQNGNEKNNGRSDHSSWVNMLSPSFYAYMNKVAPSTRPEGLKKFHVQHAMSLATGINVGDSERGGTSTSSSNGESKTDSSTPYLKVPSSSNMVSKLLNEQDLRFIKYVAQTLGPALLLKPGKDYYSWGTSAQMFSCLYVLLFYSIMTAPTASDGDVLGALQSSVSNGSFDGNMVLLLLYHIAIMITDRVGYLFRNLKMYGLFFCLLSFFLCFFVESFLSQLV